LARTSEYARMSELMHTVCTPKWTGTQELARMPELAWILVSTLSMSMPLTEVADSMPMLGYT